MKPCVLKKQQTLLKNSFMHTINAFQIKKKQSSRSKDKPFHKNERNTLTKYNATFNFYSNIFDCKRIAFQNQSSVVAYYKLHVILDTIALQVLFYN